MQSPRFRVSKPPPRKARQLGQKPAPSLALNPPDEGGERFPFVVEDEEFDSSGEECELPIYETRLNTRGEEVCLRAGTKAGFEPPKKRSHRACMVLNRYYDSDGEHSGTELEIQSRHIIKALREVIITFPGVDFASKVVTIHEPPRCLFHYQDELREHAESSTNERLKSHMQLCLQYMEKTLRNEIKVLNSIKSNRSGSFELEHRHLWVLFKPGCLVYEKPRDDGTLSRLRSISCKKNDEDEIESWSLNTELIGWNGKYIGLVHGFLSIPRYEGCKPVCDLSAIPLHFLPEEEKIRDHLLKRGQRFLSLCRMHHCFYDGVARLCSISSPKMDELELTNVSVCSLIRGQLLLDLIQPDADETQNHA